MDNSLLWIIFGAMVLPLLALDLGVFHRKAHVINLREALIWSVVWVALAGLFAGGVFYYKGADSGWKFLTGYVVEKSLSVDNVFLFAVIFSYFQVPSQYQHRVLFWGVIGAIAMRAVMIAAGAALIGQFAWIIYIFGGFLILTGIKMFLHRNETTDVSKNPVIAFLRHRINVTDKYDGQKFWTRIDGKRYATPLFLALILVEFTDLVFAVDSIPAIFAITTDPFIVFTSNIFAILGLRSLYFLLAGVMHRFVYLKIGLAAVLVFVGGKMLLHQGMGYHMHPALSLSIITGIIGVSILASLRKTRSEAGVAASTPSASLLT